MPYSGTNFSPASCNVTPFLRLIFFMPGIRIVAHSGLNLYLCYQHGHVVDDLAVVDSHRQFDEHSAICCGSWDWKSSMRFFNQPSLSSTCFGASKMPSTSRSASHLPVVPPPPSGCRSLANANRHVLSGNGQHLVTALDKRWRGTDLLAFKNSVFAVNRSIKASPSW